MIPSLSFSLIARHKTLICSSAVGETYISMERIMAPTYKYYANLHNIDILIHEQTAPFDSSRPWGWDKIIFIRHMLKFYKTVIWVDNDTIICNPANNICEDIDPKYPMQLVTHYGIVPLYPNAGVWVLQRDPRTMELLEAIWDQPEAIINHPWMDQAALLTLLGYEPHFLNDRKTIYNGPTKYSSWVGALDLKWNSRPLDSDVAEDPAILHFCGIPISHRLQLMQKYKYKTY